MPFVKRVVCPTLVCRPPPDTSRTSGHNDGLLLKDDSELVAVNNCALSNAIRQLASLAGHADEIFTQLKAQLGEINARASAVKDKLAGLELHAEKLNARSVTVPEGDLNTFWHHKTHYAAVQPTTKGLFTPESRPSELQRMYEAAGQTPVLKLRQFDRLRRDGRRASKIIMCTPVLSSQENRKARQAPVLEEIETSKPAALSRIREWRSSEVLGSSVAAPDVSLAPPVDTSTLEHLLPSPEEQLSVIARHFPPEMVAVDVTGRNFDRQQRSRRSLSQIDTRRAERHRKRRSQRRNTIAGTSAEAELLRQAADGASQMGGSESIEVDSSLQSLPGSKRKVSSTDKVAERGVMSRFNSLREWGRQRLSRNGKDQPTDLYETLAHVRRPRSTSPHVRMRPNTGRKSKRDVHSSSGNWSASSSSARASVESSSDHRTTSHLPTSSSSSTCDSALSVRRPKAMSISSSNSRESPDLPISDSTGFNDGETSSVYSCDTEGYYTSFHVDSGLKTLREEPFESNSSGNLTVCAAQISTKALSCENEYELFGKGSTSTTASSAGTICTVKAPPSPPLRKSSLENVSSDNETVERRERVKKALSTNRIPSFCAITPPLSEDEQPPSRPPSQQKQSRSSPQLKAALMPFNSIMGKMRDVLRKTPTKETPPPTPVETPTDEYVTIASIETLQRVSSMEYVSLNELPVVQLQQNPDSESESGAKSPVNSLERRRRSAGARVTLDSEGKVVYSSDSLRRKPKGTTFEPGPCVKDQVDSSSAPKSPMRVTGGARLIIKAKETPSPVVGANLAGKAGGAHVDMLKLMERGEEAARGEPAAHARENIDPNGWARGIRRNESYRLASNNPSDDVKQVSNPNTAGRKFYGAKIMVDPVRMVGRGVHQQQPLYEQQPPPQPPPFSRITVPSDTQRARVLSSGYTNGHHAAAPPSFCTIPRSWERQQGYHSSTPTKQYYRPPDCNLSPIQVPMSAPTSPLASPSRRPLVSQTRSTMSTEELYAAIHRSKKKMNIKDDYCSPTPSTCSSPVDMDRASPSPSAPGSRHSWSPGSAEALNQVGGATARNSFKRLLLEKGSKGKARVSAVEQLMATKGQFAPSVRQQQQQQTANTLHHSLGRRRYRHTDVLSATITEESEPPSHKLPPHVTARYLQQRIDQMCLSPRISPVRNQVVTMKHAPPSPGKPSLETSL